MEAIKACRISFKTTMMNSYTSLTLHFKCIIIIIVVFIIAEIRISIPVGFILYVKHHFLILKDLEIHPDLRIDVLILDWMLGQFSLYHLYSYIFPPQSTNSYHVIPFLMNQTTCKDTKQIFYLENLLCHIRAAILIQMRS